MTVRYRTAGSLNDRAPLILVHGIAGDIDSHLDYLFSMLAFRQRVIAVEFTEPAGQKLELTDLARQLRAVIDAECPSGSVSVLGYCLGAAVAAEVAADPRSRIENLVLVAGWLKTDTSQQAFANLWRALRAHGAGLEQGLMGLAQLSPAFMKLRTVDQVYALTRQPQVGGFVDKQMELYTRVDIAKACDALASRTLVIGCAQDMVAPVHHARALFGAIADCRFGVIPCGHAVMRERAAELFQHVDRFLSAPDAFPAGSILPPIRP